MKIMAVDFGDARTGLAICDRGELLASPAGVIQEKHFPTTVQKVAQQARELDAQLIVVGHPLNMDGSCGDRAKLCEEFADKLRELVTVPVELWDERQTTVSAIGYLNETNTRGKKAQTRASTRWRRRLFWKIIWPTARIRGRNRMASMQKLAGLMRRAIEKYDMIQPGDRIAIGISGGKDSMALLMGLHQLRTYIGIPYEIVGLTLDPCFSGVQTDYSPIAALCEQLGVEYICKRTEIGQIVFDRRAESNPCSLCARMRRACLCDEALAAGCNKIALGHHFDDAIETFIMNLFEEGRVASFQPVTYLSRKQVTMIRPMVMAEESLISAAVHHEGLPVVKSRCPVDNSTNRGKRTKEWIRQMDKEHRPVQKKPVRRDGKRTRFGILKRRTGSVPLLFDLPMRGRSAPPDRENCRAGGPTSPDMQGGRLQVEY